MNEFEDRKTQTEDKRENPCVKKCLREILLYGILSIMYGSVFFFGALYPDYGVPRESIRYENMEGHERENAASRINGKLKEKHTDKEKADKEKAESQEQVEYKSLLLEKVKELIDG